MVESAVTGEGAELLDALTDVVDLVTAGEGGLTALARCVELATPATGAAGAAFVELGESIGRVVAAGGVLGWTLGRPIETARPELARLLEGARVLEFASADLGVEGEREFTAQGLPTMMRAVSRVNSAPVGVLAVCYPAGAATTAVQRSALALLAAGIAQLYTIGRGLPVYGDARVTDDPAEAFAVLDPAGLVCSWNPAAARLTALAPAEAIGRPWPFPLPRDSETVPHQMACGRWIEIRSARIDGTGRRAVSFRPRPERAGQDEDRDLFVALTSHELRTPVTVIRGYADTLVEHWDALDERSRREAVFIVGQRARELSRLVDRLLMAASHGQGPMEVAPPVPFDFVEALRDAAAELTADLRRNLRVTLPASLPKAFGDRTSLVTVVTELVTNACKYSLDRVDVELTAGSDPQHVWLRVSDRGVGVRPEHVERVFERFWQMETGDQRRYGGVGLGLYLVRRIVERQQGWVSLRPRPGGGTVAEVRLPRADTSFGRV